MRGVLSCTIENASERGEIKGDQERVEKSFDRHQRVVKEAKPDVRACLSAGRGSMCAKKYLDLWSRPPEPPQKQHSHSDWAVKLRQGATLPMSAMWNLNNRRTKLRAEWFFSWLCCDVTSPCPWRRARQQLWPGFTVRQTGSWCRPQRGNSSVLLLFLSPRHDSVSSFQDVAKNRSLLSYPDCDRHINIYATLISPMGRAVGLSSAGWSACERTQLVHLWSTLWEKEDFVQLRSGWISLKTCSCHSITNSVV